MQANETATATVTHEDEERAQCVALERALSAEDEARAPALAAREAVANAQTELAEAEREYVKTPTPEQEQKIRAARDRIYFAELRVPSAVAPFDYAKAHREQCERELAAGRERRAREAKESALRSRAEIARVHERIAVHAQRILEAKRAIVEAADAIDKVVDDANAAAAELRALGHDVPDLDAFHRALPLVAARVEEQPRTLLAVESRNPMLSELSHRVKHEHRQWWERGGLAGVLTSGFDLVDRIGVSGFGREGPTLDPSADARRRKVFALLFGARTNTEALTRMREAEVAHKLEDEARDAPRRQAEEEERQKAMREQQNVPFGGRAITARAQLRERDSS